MKPHRGSRLVPVITGAVLSLLAGLIAPSAAEASCGDYVVIGARRGQPSVPMASHGSSFDPIAAGHQQPDEHTPRRTPCHGPSCSNGSGPPATPAPKIPLSGERWACPLAMFHATPTQPGWTSAVPAPRMPLHRGAALYRPPR